MFSLIELEHGMTLIHGNALEVDWSDFGRARIAIVSDPPYGINYRSRHNQGHKGARKKFCREQNWKPIQGDQQEFNPGPWLDFPWVAMFGFEHFRDKLPAGGRLLIWDKLAGKTPSHQADVEIAWTNTPGKSRIHTQLWRGIMRGGEENVSNGPKRHPNQKPAALMEWVIREMSLPHGTLIVDPYMGSGSTGIAAFRLGYPFVGVEIDFSFFESARQRIELEIRQPVLDFR